MKQEKGESLLAGSCPPRARGKPQCLLHRLLPPPVAPGASGCPADLGNPRRHTQPSPAAPFQKIHLPSCFRNLHTCTAFSRLETNVPDSPFPRGNFPLVRNAPPSFIFSLETPTACYFTQTPSVHFSRLSSTHSPSFRAGPPQGGGCTCPSILSSTLPLPASFFPSLQRKTCSYKENRTWIPKHPSLGSPATSPGTPRAPGDTAFVALPLDPPASQLPAADVAF